MNPEWIPSPNFTNGRGGKQISLVCIHWFGEGNINGAISSFQNPARQASAHYLISDDRLVQMVKEENTAWHVGVYAVNQQSIGIEHDATPDKNLSESSYQTSGRLVREICQRYNIPLDREHIKGHNEFKATQCPGTIDINKIINIAKGDNMDKNDIAKALVIARTGQPLQGEVDYIIKNFIDAGKPLEDYARNNIMRDAHIPLIWKATMGTSCPQSEIDFWDLFFRDHPDQQLIDLAGAWYKDHVVTAIKKASADATAKCPKCPAIPVKDCSAEITEAKKGLIDPKDCPSVKPLTKWGHFLEIFK